MRSAQTGCAPLEAADRIGRGIEISMRKPIFIEANIRRKPRHSVFEKIHDGLIIGNTLLFVSHEQLMQRHELVGAKIRNLTHPD
jgi:hypothetical protein